MRYLLLICILFTAQLSYGQYQKIVNQSIELNDVDRIQIDLNGNVTYQEWKGLFMLVETRVSIENCTDNLFRALLAQKRYLVDYEISGSTIKLSSHKDLGQVIENRLGATEETVSFRIFYPEGFRDNSGNLLVDSAPKDALQGSK